MKQDQRPCGTGGDREGFEEPDQEVTAPRTASSQQTAEKGRGASRGDEV